MKELEKLYDKVMGEFETFKTEHEAFAEKGNKSAARRARTASMEIRKLLKEYKSVSTEESR